MGTNILQGKSPESREDQFNSITLDHISLHRPVRPVLEKNFADIAILMLTGYGEWGRLKRGAFTCGGD